MSVPWSFIRWPLSLDSMAVRVKSLESCLGPPTSVEWTLLCITITTVIDSYLAATADWNDEVRIYSATRGDLLADFPLWTPSCQGRQPLLGFVGDLSYGIRSKFQHFNRRGIHVSVLKTRKSKKCYIYSI